MITIENEPINEYNNEGMTSEEKGMERFFKLSIFISKELLNSKEDNAFKCTK